jgi:hypothetical protein
MPHRRSIHDYSCFEMIDAIIRLRACGSNNAGQFVAAMQYYSLWDTDPGTERLLNKMPLNPEPEAKAPERGAAAIDSMTSPA